MNRQLAAHYIVVVPQRSLVVVHRVDSDRPGCEVSATQFGALLERILAAQNIAPNAPSASC